MSSLKLKICYIIVIVFSFLGMLNLSTLVHEVSHREDLKDYINESEMCLFYIGEELPNVWAYYGYTYGIGMNGNVEDVLKYTEWKAYFYQILIIFLWMLVIIGIIKD